MEKKSKIVLSALIILAIYTAYICYYAYVVLPGQGATDAEKAGSAIASAIMTPHIVLVGLSLVFTALAFFMNAKWSCITALVLVCVATVMMPLYVMFTIAPIILLGIGIAKTGNVKKENNL